MMPLVPFVRRSQSAKGQGRRHSDAGLCSNTLSAPANALSSATAGPELRRFSRPQVADCRGTRSQIFCVTPAMMGTGPLVGCGLRVVMSLSEACFNVHSGNMNQET